MAIKMPRLCQGLVVTGTTNINFLGNITSYTVSIPQGTYWNDPIYSSVTASDNPDALGQLRYLIDAIDTGATYTSAWVAPTVDGDFNCYKDNYISRSAGTFNIRGSNAGTNTAGQRFLRFVGYDGGSDYGSFTVNYPNMGTAIYDPLRGESGDMEETSTGFGTTGRTVGGVAYGYDVGAPLLSRMITMTMPGKNVRRRANSASPSAYVMTDFESLMWPWLSRGNPVRYYADGKTAANSTYLTAAMTATSTTCTTSAVLPTSYRAQICIDGEWCRVQAGAGTTTLTLLRDQPVAHGAYAPISTDFVGTYVLAQSGGNINMRGFNPSRRAVNQDRYDMAIALDRTTGV